MQDRVTRRLPDEPEEPTLPAAAGSPARSRQADTPERSSAAEQRVTQLLDIPVDELFSASFRPEKNALIDNRYRIDEGPLGEQGGEALVFRCTDLQRNETVAVKLYQGQMHPKPDVVQNMLNMQHPNLVALLDVGRWEERFYEVLEFCQGGSLLEAGTLDEEALRRLLPDVLRGLDFCHKAGLVHRDVKPANLLYRDRQRTQPALADFGISSLLAEDEQSRKTRTYLRFTLDYCAPELLRLRKVSPASDYYSLGVTILHLLQGRSPFQGMEEDAVIDAHLQAAVPMPEELSLSLKTLVRGLLQPNPQRRWGRQQVRSWLANEDVGEERPAEVTEKGANLSGDGTPYPACPEARQPPALASRLSEFNALAELRHGRLALWAGLFDQDMGRRIAELEPLCHKDPQTAILRLRHVLHPQLPLMVDTAAINSPESLAAAIRDGNQAFLTELSRQTLQGKLLAWLEATDRGPAGERIAAGLRGFAGILSQKPHLTPYVIYWSVRSSAPLPVAPGVRVRKPSELNNILEKRPEISSRLEALLYGGYLLVWLEMTHPELNEDIAFVRDCMAMQLNNRALGLQGLRWFYAPETPLLVGKKAVHTPQQLAGLLSGANMRSLGCELLRSGHIRLWLRAKGYLQNAQAFDNIVADETFSWNTRLEMVLRLLDPTRPRSLLLVDTRNIDFGELIPDCAKSREVLIERKGKGHIWGRASIPKAGGFFSVQPAEFEGPDALLTVTATPPVYLAADIEIERTLVIETNFGNCEIPLRYRTWKPAGSMTVQERPVSVLESLGKKIFGK